MIENIHIFYTSTELTETLFFFFLLVVHILIHLNRCNSIDIFQCIHKQRMECLREGSDCCILGSAGPSILSHDEII